MTGHDDVRPGEPAWYADLTPEGREKDRAERGRLCENQPCTRLTEAWAERDQAANDRAAVVAKLGIVEAERDRAREERDGLANALQAQGEEGADLLRELRDERDQLAERLDLASAVLREVRQMQVTPTPEGCLLEVLHWGGEAKALATWMTFDGEPCWVLTAGHGLAAHAAGTLGECLATVARWDVDMQNAHAQEAHAHE